MKTKRERWAESFPPTEEIWLLESHGDARLFETKDKVSADESAWWSHPEPIFHVWKGDEWLYCGPSYQAAINKYKEIIG